MSLLVRDGKFDVVVAASPRVRIWPSVGVRVVSALCADLNLKVGAFGGSQVQVRGVIPVAGSGGVLFVEDTQRRVHRIEAKSIVKMGLDSHLPNPFPGWRSSAVIPIETAERLLKEGQLDWNPMVGILGTGNRALHMGTKLLQLGVPDVFCVEEPQTTSRKRISGWEVERRLFEMSGGQIIEARINRIKQKSSLIWELRVEDLLGIRVLEVSKLISAGPFSQSEGVREYPPSSLLFELEQTAQAVRSDDVEGYMLEEERARLLAVRIAKALVADPKEKREELERVQKRAKLRLKFSERHLEEPFEPQYSGKWSNTETLKRIRSFSGVPQSVHKTSTVASIECVEDIACNLCEKSCPESAIQIVRSREPESRRFLIEGDCTACGACLAVCPSQVPVLVREQDDRSFSKLTLGWKGKHTWKVGEFASLLNRRGDAMGQARVSKIPEFPETEGGRDLELFQWVELDVPTHLLWESRGIRPVVSQEAPDVELKNENEPIDQEARVFITLNGEKRLVRDDIPITVALYEMAQNRPEDALYCPDGSCQLCTVFVDGIKQLACQTRIRKGMAILVPEPGPEHFTDDEIPLCVCEGISCQQVVDRLKQGQLSSVEAVLSSVPVGSGKCHGQICSKAFERVLKGQGLDPEHWIDWRFPWIDWVVMPGGS